MCENLGIFAVLAAYVAMAWFLVCMRRAIKQTVAKWNMITLINVNKIATGDYALIKRDTGTLTMLKGTLRLFVFNKTI